MTVEPKPKVMKLFIVTQGDDGIFRITYTPYGDVIEISLNDFVLLETGQDTPETLYHYYKQQESTLV